MNDFSHGGNLKSLAADARRPERDILDFSVNLRPEGPPEFITSALWRAMNGVTPYPSPDMQELREKAALHYGLLPECFVLRKRGQRADSCPSPRPEPETCRHSGTCLFRIQAGLPVPRSGN